MCPFRYRSDRSRSRRLLRDCRHRAVEDVLLALGFAVGGAVAVGVQFTSPFPRIEDDLIVPPRCFQFTCLRSCGKICRRGHASAHTGERAWAGSSHAPAGSTRQSARLLSPRISCGRECERVWVWTYLARASLAAPRGVPFSPRAAVPPAYGPLPPFHAPPASPPTIKTSEQNRTAVSDRSADTRAA